METVTRTLSNGNVITYQIVNGTAYHAETPPLVVNALESARRRGVRVRVWLGDRETGRDWCEEWLVLGYVGRSMGRIKIPLLVYNSRSYGGAGMLDNCILRIAETHTGRLLYEAENYQKPAFDVQPAPEGLQAKGYTTSVYRDGENVANFTSADRAQRYVDFMLGHRMAH